MAETSKRIPAKGKDRTQPTAKGCSCKRSQCIIYYCDCYQSMTACNQFCLCGACRNTEERMAVDPRIPSNDRKRDRVDAARKSSNSPVPPVSNVSMSMPPINIIRKAPDSFNVVLQQVVTEQLIPPEATETGEDLQSPEAATEVVETDAHYQEGRAAIVEFTKCVKKACEKLLSSS